MTLSLQRWSLGFWQTGSLLSSWECSHFSLSSSHWWGTRSNALEKSSSTASICCLSFSTDTKNELCLAWSALTKSVLAVGEDVVPLKVGYYTGVDDMFKGFTHNRHERDWPVVWWWRSVSLLEDWSDQGWFPIQWDCSIGNRDLEEVGQARS